jgi:hypothetical protein
MRFATIVVLALLLVTAMAVSAAVPTTNKYEPKKVDPNSVPGDGREGGETIATAWVIPSLPFDDTGVTSDNINDYDEVCPYSGSTSPDVVYVFTPTSDVCVNIDLCNSGYDTKVYVYENMWTPGAPYACNDDAACALSYRSLLEGVYMAAGNSYYIVVDGYYGASGTYELHIYEVACPEFCEPLCPAGGYLEGEPTCYTDYDDVYNGGCNSSPNVFQTIPAAPLLTICGEIGVFTFGTSTYRDTDWYEVTLTEDRQVTLRACSGYPLLFGFIMPDDCANITSFTYYAISEAYVVEELSEYLTAGTWWIAAMSADWGSCPCGTPYILEIEGTAYSPVEDASWTTIKAMYR